MGVWGKFWAFTGDRAERALGLAIDDDAGRDALQLEEEQACPACRGESHASLRRFRAQLDEAREGAGRALIVLSVYYCPTCGGGKL